MLRRKLKNKCIHETVIRDVLDAFDMAKDAPMEIIKRFTKNRGNNAFRSIAQASDNLTLVFPVIVSSAMSSESAGMITKAIERKAVVMLQMLFSAFNVTDAKDGLSFLKRFHNNINLSGKMNIDKFIDIMDSFVTENADVNQKEVWQAFKEDMNNLNYYLGEDVSEHSLSDYKLKKKFSSIGEEVYLEAQDPDLGIYHGKYIDVSYSKDKWNKDPKYALSVQKTSFDMNNKIEKDMDNKNDIIRQQGNSNRDFALRTDSHNLNVDSYYQKERQMQHQQDNSDRDYNLRVAQNKQQQANSDRDYDLRVKQMQHQQDNSDRDYNLRVAQNRQNQFNSDRDFNQRVKDSNIRNDLERRKIANTMNKDNIDYLRNQLLSSDVKKANELVPTTMIVNFISVTDDGTPVQTQMVIGVKARMYPVSSNDIITRICAKHKDKNGLFKFIKATTREISFVRDFLFCIDKAKIDALSQSKLGSSSKMWKILERRAIMSKINRNFNRVNDASAITTLAITQEEVEYMKKAYQIDLENPNVARPIMEGYNFMGISIADESDEIAKFIFDTGDDIYEELPYSQLEKEDKSHDWKKVVNLMSKMR